MGYSDRPVDMSDSFKEDGWEYCKYLITDPRSDVYLNRMKEKSDESSKLAASLQEGEEANT
tara:strand:+ start:1475 stop:1657 length:183 start_codon:yes stop_codon:yes gene_type:complete